MAYSELIKNFEHVRSYMREFFVYGFKSRTEFDRKSARSYDNERRRVESWLGDFMSFRQDESGKSVFLSVDSRTIAHNPLHRAFRAKSFTDNALTLHFYLLDLLRDEAKTVSEIVEGIDAYFEDFPDAALPDVSTIRKKLREYEALGLLQSEKHGRELAYRCREDRLRLADWAEAAAFFSEADPVGVIGSYLLARLPQTPEIFRFKHHYLLHAIDSEVLCNLLACMREHRRIRITYASRRDGRERETVLYPMRMLVSTQSGRQYLLAYHYRFLRPTFYRVDAILSAVSDELEPEPERYEGYYGKLAEHLWGTSFGRELSTDHVEMTLHVESNEGYILERLDREKRCGRVEIVDRSTIRYVADVYDASEMLPWLRTFIGRIVHLACSNPNVTETFYRDLDAMQTMYGGETDALS